VVASEKTKPIASLRLEALSTNSEVLNKGMILKKQTQFGGASRHPTHLLSFVLIRGLYRISYLVSRQGL